MRLGSLLVEAKLTEAIFRRRARDCGGVSGFRCGV